MSPRTVPVALLAAACALAAARPAAAADPDGPEVKKAIEKGVDYLRRENAQGRGGAYHQLAALAMVKGGAPKDDPVVAAAVEGVRRRCEGGTYKPDVHQLYVAGIEMMLLEAAGDPDRDRDAMRALLGYVEQTQQGFGAWFYPDKVEAGTANFGDTSITQYALLGLWTAERAGLDVDRDRWSRVARWQLATRLKGGGFAYHPTGAPGDEERLTMTAAGGCNLLLAARYLHGEKAAAAAEKEAAAAEAAEDAADAALAAKYKALKRPGAAAAGAADAPAEKEKTDAPSASSLTGAAAAAADRVGPRLIFEGNQPYPYYLLYTCERLGALSGKREFGGVDWYAVGSDWLVETADADGRWSGYGRSDVATAFAVMFLARATEKALGRKASLYAGGLLKGGRGLPDDLTQARFNGEDIEFERPTGELSDLLLSLDDPAAADVPAATAAILETVRTGDREALVGQADRLRRLIDDPRPDVRAVALWALARSGGPQDVGPIFDRLAEDPDAAVAREAHNALCVLARLPRGPEIPLGMAASAEFALAKLAARDLPATYTVRGRLRVLPAGPFVGLPFDAPDDAKAEAFEFWRKVAAATWSSWRDGVRPYGQRDLVPAPKTR